MPVYSRTNDTLTGGELQIPNHYYEDSALLRSLDMSNERHTLNTHGPDQCKLRAECVD